MLPRISVGFITFNRPKQFETVIESVFQNLIYPKELVTLVIVDDKSDSDYISGYEGFYKETVTIHRTERGGMQSSWNQMIRECSQFGEMLVPLQDDWRFTEPVDFRFAVRFLQSNPEYGFWRLHKLAGHTGLNLTIKQWQTKTAGISNYVDSPYDYDPSLACILELLPPFDGSNTYSPYSGGIHMRHREFTTFFGEYQEGIKFSHAELLYFEKVNGALRHDLNICPRFAMHPHYIQARFEDISEFSYRDTNVESETLK